MPAADYPVVDLRDTAGRLKRLAIALAIGVALAVVGFLAAAWLADPGSLPSGIYSGGQRARAYKFVGSIAGLAGAGSFMLALAVQNHLARRRWRAERLPQARARR